MKKAFLTFLPLLAALAFLSFKYSPVAENATIPVGPCEISDDYITMTLTLKSILMGECGNPADRHHEPVAGRVGVYLIDKSTGNQVPSTTRRTIIWRSETHSLVCNNLFVGDNTDTYNGAAEDLYSNGYAVNGNVNSSLVFMVDEQLFNLGNYELVYWFNLGVVHKDNDFAGAGGHWLTAGDNVLEERVPARRGFSTEGPYQTNSDRCHEFWLSFNTVIGE